MTNEQNPADTAGTTEARGWTQALLRYREPSHLRSVLELGISFGPLVALWALMWLAYSFGFWWVTLLLAVPAAGFLVRLFMIQHDCGHGAFFRHRLANDWIGRALGVLTFTPYDFWKRTHAIHHASAGNLDRRGIGDIDTLTVDEYLARSRFGRIKYRLYRHPLVMFGLGPSFLFLLQHRLPVGATRLGRMPWLSTMLTNLGIALLLALAISLMGVSTFLLLYLPMMVVGASIGVWLFYVQHQFEQTYWEQASDWSQPDAALHGSSFYDLPRWLMWLTGNIGIHHLHHLSSRIPFYRLPEALADYPELRAIGRLTLWQSLASVRLTLWDAGRRRMVPFAALRQRAA